MQRSRRNRLDLGLLLLGYQLFQFGLDRIPPVTLVTIVGQVAVFLGFVGWLDPRYKTSELLKRL